MRYWIDGVLVAAEDARVSVLDHGFTVGDGVFETMRTSLDRDGRPVAFALDRHIARLDRSARGLGIPSPGAQRVADAVAAVCAANPQLEAGGRIRVTVTSGCGPLGSDRGQSGTTMVVTAGPATAWPVTTTVAIARWPRNERSPLVGLKTTSYADNVVALAAARRVGAGEALLGNLRGEVCEGTGSNVFLVLAGRIITPPASSGCLAGITRELVLEWCASDGLPAVEETYPLSEITGVDEVFLTSSTRDVHPVVGILDEAGVPSWSSPGVGPVTARVRALFADRAARDPNP